MIKYAATPMDHSTAVAGQATPYLDMDVMTLMSVNQTMARALAIRPARI